MSPFGSIPSPKLVHLLAFFVIFIGYTSLICTIFLRSWLVPYPHCYTNLFGDRLKKSARSSSLFQSSNGCRRPSMPQNCEMWRRCAIIVKDLQCVCLYQNQHLFMISGWCGASGCGTIIRGLATDRCQCRTSQVSLQWRIQCDCFQWRKTPGDSW